MPSIAPLRNQNQPEIKIDVEVRRVRHRRTVSAPIVCLTSPLVHTAELGYLAETNGGQGYAPTRQREGTDHPQRASPASAHA